MTDFGAVPATADLADFPPVPKVPGGVPVQQWESPACSKGPLWMGTNEGWEQLRGGLLAFFCCFRLCSGLREAQVHQEGGGKVEVANTAATDCCRASGRAERGTWLESRRRSSSSRAACLLSIHPQYQFPNGVPKYPVPNWKISEKRKRGIDVCLYIIRTRYLKLCHKKK